MNAGPSRGGAGLPENRVDREIEAAPEESDRDCTCRQTSQRDSREHALDLDEDPPEPIREHRIVGTVHGVGCRTESERESPPASARSSPAVPSRQGGHHLAIEVRHGSRLQRERPLVTIRWLNHELVIDEIELHRERTLPCESGRVASPRAVTCSATPHE